MTETKECTCCLERLSVDRFSKSYTSKKTGAIYLHSWCKTCRSQYMYRKQLEKRVESFPQLYLECDECDHIYNRKHQSCPKCLSQFENPLV